MKPLQLVISAFGPFKDEVTVDFEKLGGQGLFLVSGDTGSGKTTVFDAISFALFGSPSGERRNEENNTALRSQYAAKETKTFVELTFLHKGNKYFIRRNPQYMRPSLRGGGETKENQGAELLYPDGRKVVDYRKVTNAVEELLGINWAQYKQIAMIAQGEFLELLVADSDKRSTILRKIFGTGIYVNIQERLATITNRLRNECETITNSIFQYFDDVQCPKENPHYEPIQVLVRNRSIHETMNLMEEVLALVNEKKEEHSQVVGEYKKLDHQLTECRKRIAQIEQINSMYVSYEQAKAEEQMLLASTSLMEEKKEVMERGSLALHHIKPLADVYDTLVNEEMVLAKKLTELKAEEAALVVQFKALNEEKQTQEKNQPRIEELAAILVKRREEAAKYKQIESLENKCHELQEQVTSLQKKTTMANQSKGTYEQRREASKQELIQLKDVEVQKATIEASMEQKKQTKQTIQNIQIQFDQILEEQDKLAQAKAELTQKMAHYNELDASYKQAELLYYKELAGLMADKLEVNMPCPVCGSTHHPNKASLATGALTKEELQELKEKVEQALSIVQKDSENCNTRANTLTFKKETLIQAVKPFPTLEVIEFVQEESVLFETHIQELTNALLLLQKDYEKVLEGMTRKSTLEKEQTTIEEQIKELQEELANGEKQLNETMQQLSADNASLTTLKGEVSFGSLNELKQKATEEQKEYTLLKKTLEDVTSRYQEINAKLQQTLAVLQDNSERQKTVTARMATAKEDYENALNKRGFASASDYREALRSEQELKQMQQDIMDFRDKVTKVKQSLEELGKALQGRERKDLSKDKEEESQLLEQKEAYEERIQLISSQTNRNIEILKKVKAAYSQHKDKTDEYGVYERLSKTANGNLSGKAKIAFEQYVQAFYFDQILEAANKRLGAMSNSQYELQRKEEATNLRKNTGLDIEVMDHYSGKARSVKTLSGGESFKAALSLALGLSDIIQSFAGGIEVDAMFVDEGFGSLDSNSLEQALSALNALTLGNRLVGIISHVSELKERIDKKILLEKDREGSKLKLEV